MKILIVGGLALLTVCIILCVAELVDWAMGQDE